MHAIDKRFYMGNRPILSVATNLIPDKIHPEAMSYYNLAKNILCKSVLRTVRPNLADDTFLRLMSMPSLFLSRRLTEWVISRVSDEAWIEQISVKTEKVIHWGVDIFEESEKPISVKNAVELQTVKTSSRMARGDKCFNNKASLFINKIQIDVMKKKLTGFNYAIEQEQQDDHSKVANSLKPEDLDGRACLVKVITGARNIIDVDLFLRNSVQVGEYEISLASQSGDYFLAAKLRLHRNYMLVRNALVVDGGMSLDEIMKEECKSVAYQFNEKTMSFEQASKQFFEYLKLNKEFTHGALICCHKDGRVSSRIVHAPCEVLKDITLKSATVDDAICMPNFNAHVEKVSKMISTNEITNNPKYGFDDEILRGWVGRITLGFLEAVKYGGLAIMLDEDPGVSLTCALALMSEIPEQAQDYSAEPLESLMKLFGIGIGWKSGFPITGMMLGLICSRAQAIYIYGGRIMMEAVTKTPQDKLKKFIDSVLRVSVLLCAVQWTPRLAAAMVGFLSCHMLWTLMMENWVFLAVLPFSVIVTTCMSLISRVDNTLFDLPFSVDYFWSLISLLPEWKPLLPLLFVEGVFFQHNWKFNDFFYLTRKALGEVDFEKEKLKAENLELKRQVYKYEAEKKLPMGDRGGREYYSSDCDSDA